jgi:hypothetical protein
MASPRSRRFALAAHYLLGDACCTFHRCCARPRRVRLMDGTFWAGLAILWVVGWLVKEWRAIMAPTKTEQMMQRMREKDQEGQRMREETRQ